MKLRQLASDSIEQLRDLEISLKSELLRQLSNASTALHLRRSMRKNLARVLTAVNCRSGFNSEVV